MEARHGLGCSIAVFPGEEADMLSVVLVPVLLERVGDKQWGIKQVMDQYKTGCSVSLEHIGDIVSKMVAEFAMATRPHVWFTTATKPDA